MGTNTVQAEWLEGKNFLLIHIFLNGDKRLKLQNVLDAFT